MSYEIYFLSTDFAIWVRSMQYYTLFSLDILKASTADAEWMLQLSSGLDWII